MVKTKLHDDIILYGDNPVSLLPLTEEYRPRVRYEFHRDGGDSYSTPPPLAQVVKTHLYTYSIYEQTRCHLLQVQPITQLCCKEEREVPSCSHHSVAWTVPLASSLSERG